MNDVARWFLTPLEMVDERIEGIDANDLSQTIPVRLLLLSQLVASVVGLVIAAISTVLHIACFLSNPAENGQCLIEAVELIPQHIITGIGAPIFAMLSLDRIRWFLDRPLHRLFS